MNDHKYGAPPLKPTTVVKEYDGNWEVYVGHPLYSDLIRVIFIEGDDYTEMEVIDEVNEITIDMNTFHKE